MLMSALADEICQSLENCFDDQEDAIGKLAYSLPTLLKDFSIDLKSSAKSAMQENVTVFVRHYRE